MYSLILTRNPDQHDHSGGLSQGACHASTLAIQGIFTDIFRLNIECGYLFNFVQRKCLLPWSRCMPRFSKRFADPPWSARMKQVPPVRPANPHGPSAGRHRRLHCFTMFPHEGHSKCGRHEFLRTDVDRHLRKTAENVFRFLEDTITSTYSGAPIQNLSDKL